MAILGRRPERSEQGYMLYDAFSIRCVLRICATEYRASSFFAS